MSGLWKSYLSARLAKIGNLPDNYFEVEADGTIKYNGSATVFDDLPPIPLFTQRVGAAGNPTLTAFIGNIRLLTFAVNDYVYFNYELIHAYKEGSDLTCHLHIASNGLELVSKYAKYEVEYSVSNGGLASPYSDSFPASTIISAEIEIPASTPDRAHAIAPIGTITGTGFKIGAYIVGRFRRIASAGTAPAADPFCITLGFHAEHDTTGSRQLYIK